MTRLLRAFTPLWRDERGIALPLALMGLVVLGTLSAALLAIGGSEVQVASNHLRGTQALFIAEAGVQRVIRDFVADPNLVTNAGTNTTTLFNNQALQAGSLGTIGTYTVTYRSIGWATVQAISTGKTNLGGGERTADAVVTTHVIPNQAIEGERGVTTRGTARVNGQCGAVHANQRGTRVLCTGGLCATQTATSSTSTCENCTDPNRVGVPSTSGGGKPTINIPKISPTDFAADYTLGDDGVVRDKNGVAMPSGWGGWSLNQRGEWINNSDTPPNGAYYATKAIRVNGNPGVPGNPWKATLLSGDTTQRGEVVLRYAAAVMEPAASGLPLVVAGKVEVWFRAADMSSKHTDDQAEDTRAQTSDDDTTVDPDRRTKKSTTDSEEDAQATTRPRTYIELTGTIIGTSQTTRHQNKDRARVRISGDVRLKGNILARGVVDLNGGTVTYDCAPSTRLVGPVRIISWSNGAK